MAKQLTPKQLTAFVKKHIEPLKDQYLIEFQLSGFFTLIRHKESLTDILLQDHESYAFFDKVKELFNRSQFLTMPECALFMADSCGYLDLLEC
jgi:hypothetical protein